MIGLLIFGIALIGMIYASWTDIRIREVPNRISFGLILLVFIFRLGYSLYMGNMQIFYESLLVGLIFLGIGLAFFYAQQWGGADTKLLVVLGLGFSTILPDFHPVFIALWPFAITLILNFFIISVVYALAYSFFMAFENPRVIKDFRASITSYGYLEVAVLAGSSLLILVAGFYEKIFWVLLSIPILWSLSKFLKAVEKNCMYKRVYVDHLVEFDVPEHDIKVGKEVIVSKKDPNGMTLEQIERVKKLAKAGKIPKTIKIKWGIPLIPVFPLTLIISLFIGDLFYAALQLMS